MAFSGLWWEGFSSSRSQECWLEALDKAGYQGFPADLKREVLFFRE